MSLITCLSISHRWASVDGIEKARLRDPAVSLCRLMAMGASEAIALQTCNRVELYVVSDDPETLKKFAEEERLPPMRFISGDEALMHLLRLASGLESMIIGEDQILGQLKSAYLQSDKYGAMGPVLSTAILRAIDCGKRARRETRINKGCVSIGSAAIDLAESMLGNLKEKTILVVGAGEMGTLVAKGMAEKNLMGIYVANRTYEHAVSLAADLGGVAVKLDDICEYIGLADVIICATAAPHLILTKNMVETKLCKPLLIVDITNPRNVEESISALPGVALYNMDSLKQLSEANLEKRRSEVTGVERIIAEDFEYLKKAYKRQGADQVVRSIYRKTDEIRLEELQKAVARLTSHGGLTEPQIKIISEFSQSLTSKILSAPTRQLKIAAERGDDTGIRMAMELFDMEEKHDELSSDKAKAFKAQ